MSSPLIPFTSSSDTSYSRAVATDTQHFTFGAFAHLFVMIPAMSVMPSVTSDPSYSWWNVGFEKSYNENFEKYGQLRLFEVQDRW